MTGNHVRSGFDQKPRWLSRLLHAFRGRGEFRRQRERTNPDRVAKLLDLAARISGRRAGRELAAPIGLRTQGSVYRNGQVPCAGILEGAVLKDVARILLYAAAAIGLSVPLGAVAFVCLALIGF
jgi:hypothetical protein